MPDIRSVLVSLFGVALGVTGLHADDAAGATVTRADYAKSFVIAVSPQVGEHGGTGLVIPVRLSSTRVQGFSYGDFRLASGGDLAFFDSDGMLLPHEIGTWDTSGESLVWVRFSRVETAATITCCYGGPQGAPSAARTWEGYTGVWHLDELKEDGSTYANSSPLGTAVDGTKATFSTAATAGRFGGACYINNSSTHGADFAKGGIIIPGDSDLGLGAKFTLSGWFKHKNQGYYYDYFFSTRPEGETTGFRLRQKKGWSTSVPVEISGGSTVKASDTDFWPDTMCSDWGFCTFVFDGTSVRVYQNGELYYEGTMTAAVTGNGNALVIGNRELADVDGTGDCAWCGWVDEVRVKGGVAMTAAEVATEYALAANADVLTYGIVQDASAAQALTIASNMGMIGSPVPAYGNHLSNEDIATASAGSDVVTNGVIYGVTSYTTETSADGGLIWSDPVVHEGNSFAYAYDGKLTRVTWLWAPVAVAVEVGSSHATGSLAYSVEPYRTVDGVRYYAVGTTLEVTAQDAEAESFACWKGAGAGVVTAANVATITVGETPVKLLAVSRHAWRYMNKVLTDDNWVLGAQLSGSEVGIKSVTTAPAHGILDLTSGVSDTTTGATLSFAAIENDAFASNTVLRAVLLPNGFRKFGWRAFLNCTSLEEVSPFLPESLESCGGQTFEGCTSLGGALEMLGARCTSLANKTFARTQITSVRVPNVKDFSGGSVFEYNTVLTNAVLSGAVNLGARCFRGCTALASVTLGESLTTLGYEAFNSCTSLVSVTPMLPKSLTTFTTTTYNGTLNNQAFTGCPSLAVDVRLENPAVRDIFGQVFQNCGVTSVYAPHVTNVWKYAFNGAAAMTNLTFGAASVNLNAYCPIFNNATSLEVFFPGAAPILDKAVSNCPLGNRNYIRAYCDPTMDPEGWAALLASDSFLALTDADRALASYPGNATLGFLTDGAGHKYWLVKYKSSLRPSGLRVYLR